MHCQTCGDAASPGTDTCPRCRTPYGQPAVTPGLPTYAVRGPGLAAAVAVGLTAVAYLVLALAPVLALPLVERAAADRDGDLLLGAAVLEGVLALVFLLVQIVAGVLVIIWTWRARKNTDAFPGALPSLGVGWSIAGWLVPFANLVVPARVVANIARDSLWRPTRGLVALWWSAWLVFSLWDGAVSLNDEWEFATLAENPTTEAEFREYVDYYQGAQLRYLVPAVACVVAAAAFVVLLHRISAAQQDRLDRAAVAWPPAPYPPPTGGPYPPQPVTPWSPQVATEEAPVSPPVPPRPGGTIGA
ncbi:DUF4328 domain-containing protein [Micromonospora sp. CPCC 205711]|uniref:DUF4328 domain-containing protein n=1 Tax=Micromonospora sp. CPCC 205547 TaxID=3122400 RepID=UPI002FF07C06